MSRIVLSPKAKADLSEVWNYTYTQWGVEQTEKYIRELWGVIVGLTDNLTMSVDIDVIRILHQKMDFNRHL